ncbi:hypothetical protein BGZ83_005574, partial [Gryganskiella cystojenkinii]
VILKGITHFIINTIDPMARDLFVFVFVQYYRQQVKEIDLVLKDIFEDEENLFTLSAQYKSDVYTGRTRNNQIPDLLRELSVNDMNTG